MTIRYVPALVFVHRFAIEAVNKRCVEMSYPNCPNPKSLLCRITYSPRQQARKHHFQFIFHIVKGLSTKHPDFNTVFQSPHFQYINIPTPVVVQYMYNSCTIFVRLPIVQVLYNYCTYIVQRPVLVLERRHPCLHRFWGVKGE